MDYTSKLGGIGDSITSFFTRKNPAVTSEPPRLQSAKLVPFGPFQFSVRVSKGMAFEIQAGADLRNWEPIWTSSGTGEPLEFVDSAASKHDHRFYRALASNNLLSGTLAFVKVTLAPGFTMIANPLNAVDNRVAALFPNLPDGTSFNKFDTTLFKLTKNGVANGKWNNPEETLSPGEGAIISNPTTEYRTLSFVGEVMRGDLSLPLPSGFSIRSSMLPLPGVLDADLGFPMVEGDVVHLFDRDKQEYVVYSFEDKTWKPAPPVVATGEAFWIGKATAGNWVQTNLLSKEKAQASTGR